MAIDIRNFVNVNIAHHTSSNVNATRDVAVLFTTEGDAGVQDTFVKLDDLKKKYPTLIKTIAYASIFFGNAGNKLLVIQGISDASTSLGDAINALDDKYIVCGFTGAYSTIKAAAVARQNNANVYGIKKKILVTETDTIDTDSIEGLAVKYIKDNTQSGYGMAIAAYLTNVNVYGNESIHDYDFTVESLEESTTDDSVLKSVMANNMNACVYLANNVRNIGGNLKNGLDITNEFTLIVLQQTVTDRLLDVLVQKIKGQSGLASIHSAMSQELDKYVVNGYLTTDKVWGDNDMTVTYNSKTYTIIDANTPLSLGYHIAILPLSSLSESDKSIHKTPPIYVVLADSYGIRQIEITGEVY